jgi:hypothetical protein
MMKRLGVFVGVFLAVVLAAFFILGVKPYPQGEDLSASLATGLGLQPVSPVEGGADEGVTNGQVQVLQDTYQCACEADAGPDQTVPGPSPVNVRFDGSGSTGAASYLWLDQFGEALSNDRKRTILVNFGKDAPAGTTRTFTLEVSDSAGRKDQDQVVITLGKTPGPPAPPPEKEPPAPPKSTDPRATASSGAISSYTYKTETGTLIISTGFLNSQTKWIVAVDRSDYQKRIRVDCDRWKAWRSTHQKGCVGPTSSIKGFAESLDIITYRIEGKRTASWMVVSEDTVLATIRPAHPEIFKLSMGSTTLWGLAERE